MRFTTDIIFKGEPPFRVPTNYRIKIASILKESVKKENPDLYHQFWGNEKANTAKPFTFCAYIPDVKQVKEKSANFLEFSGDKMGITVSSSEPALIMNFYNSLLNISGYTPFKNDIEFRHFHLAKDISFNCSSFEFRLMSPLILRNMMNRTGKEYITYDHPAFTDNLYHSVLHQCRDFIDKDYLLKPDDFSYTPVSCKMVKVFHYKEVIPGMSGTFRLDAPPDVLKLVYDIGIGARRSQGFGMVEVVK